MRLIDADEMKKNVKGNTEGVAIIKEWIDSQPTVRAVNVDTLLNPIKERYEFYGSLDDPGSIFVAGTLSCVIDEINDALKEGNHEQH